MKLYNERAPKTNRRVLEWPPGSYKEKNFQLVYVFNIISLEIMDNTMDSCSNRIVQYLDYDGRYINLQRR